jgi:hypothetical protein
MREGTATFQEEQKPEVQGEQVESDDERSEGRKGHRMRERRARRDDTVTVVPSHKGVSPN